MKELVPYEFEGVFLIKRNSFNDDRGTFTRIFSVKEALSNYKFKHNIDSVNISNTLLKGSFRGFHYQDPPFAESKIITCIEGNICDICIDMRKKSPTYLSHFKLELSSSNNISLIIPEGIAHGFQSLEDNSRILYLHSERYASKYDNGVSLFDPLFKIELPLPLTKISIKDSNYKFINN